MIQQEKTGDRYRVLLAMGSSCRELCHSTEIQIRWHYGLALGIAFFSSIFGVQTLFRLIGHVQDPKDFWLMAVGVILLLCLTETAYIIGVKKISNRRILNFIQRKEQE